MNTDILDNIEETLNHRDFKCKLVSEHGDVFLVGGFETRIKLLPDEMFSAFFVNSPLLVSQLVDEVRRLRAALKYIGDYNENSLKHHEPSSAYFHVKEVARENLECEVDYRDKV